LVVVIAGGACLVVYVGLALLFKIEELQWLARLLKRRFSRA